MIDVKHLTRQLELSFWAVTIPMLSRSKTLQIILPAIYDMSRREYAIPLIKRIGLLSLSGFMIGIVLGLAIS